MRICILTQADSLAWAQHYVDAFRQRAEVLTVGPSLTAKERKGWGVDSVLELLTPNDIEVTLNNDLDLRTVLPPGWEPDLLVGISKGGIALRTLPGTIICPSVYLSIDTWQSPGDYVDAQCYDFTFVAQRSFADRLVAAGASNVEWLPLACNPAVHFPTSAQPDHDIAFVGSIILPVHQQRHDLLQKLQDSFSSIKRTRAFGREVCDTMARGRIAFNHCAVSDLNMRVFEAMAMNRPLLTNRDSERNGLLDLFEDGKHLILYEDENDIVEKAAHFLENKNDRDAISKTGYETVLKEHTYLHRVDTILEKVASAVPALQNGGTAPGGRLEHPLGNMVPYGARKVVDFGLATAAVAQSLIARGTVELIGIADEAAPKPYYAQVVPLDDRGNWPKQADTVVVPDSSLIHENVKDAIRIARNMLVPGGTLIIRLSAQDVSTGLGISTYSDLETALPECGMHFNMGIVDDRPGDKGVIIRSRKRVRRLRSIFDDGFRDLPDMDPRNLSEWVDALGEHY